MYHEEGERKFGNIVKFYKVKNVTFVLLKKLNILKTDIYKNRKFSNEHLNIAARRIDEFFIQVAYSMKESLVDTKFIITKCISLKYRKGTHILTPVVDLYEHD